MLILHFNLLVANKVSIMSAIYKTFSHQCWEGVIVLGGSVRGLNAWTPSARGRARRAGTIERRARPVHDHSLLHRTESSQPQQLAVGQVAY